jgi:putative CocE/NonD family hydrolase
MQFFFRMMLKKLGVTQTHPVTIRKNIRVRMPDGAELATDLYLGSPDAKAPAIMIRSPYGISVLLAAGMAYPLAANGYNVVMQSCRGTFASTGKFDPHHDEQRDGLATIEWIKRQPWYGGAIGTYGPSYLGYTQWAVAAAAGPEVKAMGMQATLSDFSLMTYMGDSFALENALGWTHMVNLMKKPNALLRLLLQRLTKRPPISAQQWRLLPLGSLDETVAGNRVDFWQDWMQHDTHRDPWWAPMSHRRTIPQVKRSITMAAGWYDIFLPFQMDDFAALRAAGCDARITIGPWRHQDFGMGHAGMHESLALFDRQLRGKPAAAPEKPVKLQVIGTEEWRYFDEWPPREAHTERWYLQPDRKLSPQTAPDSQPDLYRYDPADPTPSVGGPALDMVPFSVDNTQLEARADVITYTSEPLAQQRDIIGPVTAELHVSSTARSADFFVRLCDVDANGMSKNICDGLQRVHIENANTPQFVRVQFWPTAYRMAQRHRLRVQISSGAFPRWARNLGGGESMATATQLQAATQSVHHSAAHPSAIILPFV